MRRRHPGALVVLAAVLLSVPVVARDLPNLNVRGQTRVLSTHLPRSVPAGVPGQVASRDERSGAPTFIWADPSRVSSAASSALAARASVDAVARAHLGDYAPHFGLSSDAVKGLEVRSIHDSGVGPILVRFAPRAGTLEIFGESLVVVMDRYRQPVAISGTVFPAVPGEGDVLLRSFRLPAEQVVSAAYRDLVGLDGFGFRATGVFKGDFQYFELAGSGAPERLTTPARAKPVAFRNGKRLEPAYYLELDTRDGAGAQHGYGYVVSARTGQVLVRTSLIQSETYRVWADTSGIFRPYDGPYGTSTSPSASGTVGATPLPALASSNLVTLGHGPISTNDPWLPAGATETRGNNVDAYADLVPGDGFTAVNPDGGVPDFRADATAPGVFDRSYDFGQQPFASANQAKAAITQLFFLNNWFHDWYYDVGFDEAAGNAQQDNLGRASQDGAGDPLHAEAEDFGGFDNANMFTPTDGASPRMQMYLFHGFQDNHLTVNSPPSVAGNYLVGVSTTFGPQSFNVTGEVVVVNEAGSTLGCDPLALNLTGRIALIDRGTCAFSQKVKNAQNAGAAGVLIANNAAGAPGMGGTDASVTIGALLISNTDGAAIKTAAAGGTVNATLFRQDPSSIIFLDGALDGSVVAHEWGHFIGNRLVGGGYGFNVPVTNGMGEGWADFHALLMIVRAEDVQVASNAGWSGTYAVGPYATSGAFATDPVYFGIRRYPYSTDMTKNPLTFKHITSGVPLPAGVPVAFGGDNAEVHNTGEIWAQMLWECYAALLNAHDFATAELRMRTYLVAAYKATPPNPTFVEARDAVLAVVGASDPGDYQLFGQAFAKRGIGAGAIAPDRFDDTNGQSPNPPLVESFSWEPDLYLSGLAISDSRVTCDNDGVLDRGETALLALVLQNGGKTDLSQGTVRVSTAFPGVSIADGGVFPMGTIAAGKTATLQVPVSAGLGIDAGPSIVDLDITLHVPELDAGVIASRQLSGSVSLRIDTDDLASSSASDDVEGTTTAWTARSAPASNNPWFRIQPDSSSSNHAWFAEDADRASDESLITPTLKVGTAPLVLTFQGSWLEESDQTADYDGVVVEVSDDSGSTWKDVTTVGGTLSPGYNVTLFDPGASPPGFANPLRGRRAWGRANAAAINAGTFPTFETVTVNLGTGFANKEVKVRFRSGTDVGGFAAGFLLDDLTVTGITDTPFVKLVADRLKCVPTADAGVSLTVNERAPGTLPGSVVQAAGTTPPTLLWTQTSGPSITLSDATVAQPTFVAPEVPADTAANFTLTATGIQGTSTSNLTVTIKDLNRPPVARITGPTTVQAKGSITLSGSTSSDPDGDTLTFAWGQTSGPQVNLQNANTASVSFTAPDSSGNVGIQLEVMDSSGASATATTTIEVQKKSGCSTSGGSPLPLLALLALGLLARARRRTA